MPVLTEEILDFICLGRWNPVTKRASGGHLWDATPNGRGKKEHSEFPVDWTRETVREAFYHLIQFDPVFRKTGLLFRGTYRGVEIKIEYSFNEPVGDEKRLHMYPIRGRGVRLWKNGKEVKVSQKRRK